MFYDQNISLLKSHFPTFEDYLNSLPKSNNSILIKNSKKGPLTVAVEGVFIHSSYDPEKEAEKLVSSSYDGLSNLLVLIGFGFGYHALDFLNRAPDASLIIFEPNVTLFIEALKCCDFATLFSKSNITLIIGASSEALFAALNSQDEELATLICLTNGYDNFTNCFTQAKDAVQRWKSKCDINRNTLKQFGKLWVKNLSRNIESIAKYPGLHNLKSIFQGIPACVVAAGPSLDELIPHLREIKKRALIICVDTALRALKRADIQADFVIVVDPQYWNTRHLDRMEMQNSYLISESAAHPKTFQLPYKGIYLCSSLFPLGKYIEKNIGIKGELGAGGSVATSAWDFARILGCNPIYMAGLDLGFPGKATHARGSYFEEKANLLANRFKPTETYSIEALINAHPFPVKANDGSTVFTDKRMILYAWWFESRVIKENCNYTYSFSQKGTAIPGIHTVSFEDFLKRDDIRYKINTILHSLHYCEMEYSDILSKTLGSLVIKFKEIRTLSLKALELSESISLSIKNQRDISTSLKELENIDNQILVSEVRELISFLLPNLIELFKKADANPIDSLHFSEKLYSAIIDVSDYHLQLLNHN